MEENILFDKKVIRYKKTQAFSGRLVITNKTIPFNQDQIKTPGIGLLDSILSKKSKRTRGGELLNQPLNNVNFTKGKSIGKKTFLLEVSTEKDVFKFLFDNDWFSKTKSMVSID